MFSLGSLDIRDDVNFVGGKAVLDLPGDCGFKFHMRFPFHKTLWNSLTHCYKLLHLFLERCSKDETWNSGKRQGKTKMFLPTSNFL